MFLLICSLINESYKTKGKVLVLTDPTEYINIQALNSKEEINTDYSLYCYQQNKNNRNFSICIHERNIVIPKQKPPTVPAHIFI